MSLITIILAAGKGTRMKSNLPKVLQPIAGKPMLQHVIDTANQASSVKTIVIYGHGGEQVQQAISDDALVWLEQTEQLGTGHAVQQALPEIEAGKKVLILFGDVPLVRLETLQDLLAIDTPMTLLTARPANPFGYGRIIRGANGDVEAIVEHKDASEEQRKVGEINTGILVVDGDLLLKYLPQLSNNNVQGEYYLTDIVAMAKQDGVSIGGVCVEDADETEGANNRQQLAQLERYFQIRNAQQLMTNGLHIIDPARIDVRGELSVGMDCVVDVNCVFEGKVTLGNNVSIGANCILKDCTIADNATIKPSSMIDESIVGEACDVGPYARLRPGTELKVKAKVGNFVETKKTTLGEGSKANHLTYLGDASIGKDVNVGAGTITCNYDGVNKFKTELDDGVFIGSNSSLVAPIKLGKNATTGAGSVVTTDVGENELAVGRAKQRNISSWKRPEKKGDK